MRVRELGEGGEGGLLALNMAEPWIMPLIGGMRVEHSCASLSTLLPSETSHLSTAILAPRSSISWTKFCTLGLSSPLREARMIFFAPCPINHFVIA